MKNKKRQQNPLPRYTVQHCKAHLLFAEIYQRNVLQYYFRVNLN